MFFICIFMIRFLDSVPVTAIEYFKGSAEKLIQERGAVEALAAALAHISGATSLEQRSLLNSDAVRFLNAHTCKVKILSDPGVNCCNLIS